MVVTAATKDESRKERLWESYKALISSRNLNPLLTPA